MTGIPGGTRVCLDSNILVYGMLGRSTQCRDLLDRCTRGEIQAVASSGVIEEATHKLMLAEAKAAGLIREERASLLADKPEVIKSLTRYWRDLSIVLANGIQILEVLEQDLHASHVVRERVGLMTRDSIIVAVAARHLIANLVTNDHLFERLAELQIYRPTDL